MDTCEILDIVARVVVLLAAIASLIDCHWRRIPETITKFRVLLTVYTSVTILRQILRVYSTVVAEGVLSVLVSGLVWPLVLYFLEHFVRVFLTIDLKDRTKDVSKLFTTFRVARIATFVLFTMLAIAFGFVPVNGISLGQGIITAACNVSVALPVCATILRLIFAIRAYRKESSDTNPEREKKLKATYRQLVVFFVILSTCCSIALVIGIRKMIDQVKNLDAAWVPPVCNTGSAFYITTMPFILALYLTRSPSAQRRKRATFSSTRSTSDSSHDGTSKRSQLKQPATTTASVSASSQLAAAREV